MPTTITLKKTPFLKQLKAVVQNIASQNAIPVLKYVYIDVQEKALVLKSSNSTTTLEKTIPAGENTLTITGEPTQLLLDAKFFLNVANSLADDTIDFIIDKDTKKATFKTPSTEMALKGLDASEYPRIKGIDNETAILLDTKAFVDALNKTVISVSKQESRPILTGVHMVAKEDKLLIEATDSHTLSQKDLPKPENLDPNLSIVIPALSVKQLQQLTGDNLLFSYDQTGAIFRTGDTTLTTRLIEGNYPETDRLLLAHYGRQATFDTAEIKNTLKRAQIILSANSQHGHTTLKTDGLATISAKAIGDEANLSETLTTFSEILDDDEDTNFSITFDPALAIKLLATIDSETVAFDFLSSVRPCQITPTDDTTLRHLLTPIRTN